MNNGQNLKNPEENDKKMTTKVGYFLLLELGLEFAVILALPLLVFVYLGKWLDQRLNTNFLVVIGILLALSFSSLLIYKKIIEVKKLLK